MPRTYEWCRTNGSLILTSTSTSTSTSTLPLPLFHFNSIQRNTSTSTSTLPLPRHSSLHYISKRRVVCMRVRVCACFTNILHHYSSPIFLINILRQYSSINILHQYSSPIFFINILHQYSSSIFFTGLVNMT